MCGRRVDDGGGANGRIQVVCVCCVCIFCVGVCLCGVCVCVCIRDRTDSVGEGVTYLLTCNNDAF